MNETPIIQPVLPTHWPTRVRSRSMGLKLLVVCVLALLMMLPALYVGNMVNERTARAGQVVSDISSHVGGQQTFLGPTLVIPYSIPATALASPKDTPQHGLYVVFPAQAAADMKVSTEERRRSLFKVPVFQADAHFDATFDLSGVPALAPAGADLDWSRAEMVVGVSDARGALADATLTTNGRTATLTPADVLPILTIGAEERTQVRLALFGARLEGGVKPDRPLHVSSALRFSGAQRLAVLAYGKTTQVTARGDWASPGFDGGFLPVTREVSAKGFRAEWTVPFIARGVRAEGPMEGVSGLEATALGLSFVEVADAYQSVNRSLKYALLFLGLVFLSYFLFEVTTGKRVHPAQYVLVGIVQIIFYLLLLSLAERAGFDAAFGIAGTATVTLLAANAGWVFGSRRQAVRAFAVFALLYTLIYLMLRLEDNALLVGAVASFLAVAAAMYFTRGIDWYSSLAAKGGAEAGTPKAPGISAGGA